MGKMELTPELLEARNERVNVWSISNPTELVSGALDMEIEQWLDYTTFDKGLDIQEYLDDKGLDIMDIASPDFTGACKMVAKTYADFLEDWLPELFGPGAPVRFESYDPSEFSLNSGVWGSCDSAMYRWTINGQQLYDLAKSYGIDSIDDGRGHSGFWRTAPDSYWSQLQVIQEIIELENKDMVLEFSEYFRESWEPFLTKLWDFESELAA